MIEKKTKIKIVKIDENIIVKKKEVKNILNFSLLALAILIVAIFPKLRLVMIAIVSTK
tara:strand:- start:6109 stop:6282 length:174 start_codon:yes stop_codon:yes gene_type:complete